MYLSRCCVSVFYAYRVTFCTYWEGGILLPKQITYQVLNVALVFLPFNCCSPLVIGQSTQCARRFPVCVFATLQFLPLPPIDPTSLLTPCYSLFLKGDLSAASPYLHLTVTNFLSVLPQDCSYSLPCSFCYIIFPLLYYLFLGCKPPKDKDCVVHIAQCLDFITTCIFLFEINSLIHWKLKNAASVHRKKPIM